MSLFPIISWFVLYLILHSVFTNPMFLSTNSLSIVYTFSCEYISISSHIVVCPLFNIASVHKPERNIYDSKKLLTTNYYVLL